MTSFNEYEQFVKYNIDAGYSEKTAKTLAKQDVINGYCKYEPNAFEKRCVKKYSEYCENYKRKK